MGAATKVSAFFCSKVKTTHIARLIMIRNVTSSRPGFLYLEKYLVSVSRSYLFKFELNTDGVAAKTNELIDFKMEITYGVHDMTELATTVPLFWREAGSPESVDEHRCLEENLQKLQKHNSGSIYGTLFEMVRSNE